MENKMQTNKYCNKRRIATFKQIFLSTWMFSLFLCPMILFAKGDKLPRGWKQCEKYVFIQAADWQTEYVKEAYCRFGSSQGKNLGVGIACMFYVFERDMDTFTRSLHTWLSESEKYGVPLLIELDPITFWDNVPELWNWFDPTLPGYNEANKESVEWTSWKKEDAVKIGWFNWGKVARLKPMANLFAPRYQTAVQERYKVFLDIIYNWYKKLPKKKRYLLTGIKFTGELAFGQNNWYYPNGNSYYEQWPNDSSHDPNYSHDFSQDPSYGFVQMGYASLSYSGIKKEGVVTAEDIVALESKYMNFVADIVDDYFPRRMIFGQSGTKNEHLGTSVNPRCCPSWSLYEASAHDLNAEPKILEYLQKSNAPYWGAAEWALTFQLRNKEPQEAYYTSIKNILSEKRCRFLTIFQEVLGNYVNAKGKPYLPAIQAIQQLQEEYENGL